MVATTPAPAAAASPSAEFAALRADLERCRERLQGGAIDPFPLGERVADRAVLAQGPREIPLRAQQLADLAGALHRQACHHIAQVGIRVVAIHSR